MEPNLLVIYQSNNEQKIQMVKGLIENGGIKRIVEEKQPLAILCGHVHEYEGAAKIGRTELIKVPAANNNKLCDLTIRNKNTYVEYITV